MVERDMRQAQARTECKRDDAAAVGDRSDAHVARALFSTVALAAVAVVVAAAAFIGAATPTASRAESSAFRWWTRSDSQTGVELVVQPVDHDEWTDYIAASNERLDRWLAMPETAPDLTGTYIALTFVRPISVPFLLEIVAPLPVVVVRATSVGQDDRGDLVEETSLGAPLTADLDRPRFDAAAGYSFTLQGVLMCVLQFCPAQSESSCTLGLDGRSDDELMCLLDALRRNEFVHLLDTTAIQAHKVDLPSLAPGLGSRVSSVLFDSPWHLLEW